MIALKNMKTALFPNKKAIEIEKKVVFVLAFSEVGEVVNMIFCSCSLANIREQRVCYFIKSV
jgi:hypothetical protein